MNADIERYVAHAYFISPIVDMEKLITDMMGWANVTEPDLQGRRILLRRRIMRISPLWTAAIIGSIQTNR